MICTQCAEVASDEDRFCESCGATLLPACRSCGAPASEITDDGFCGQCGIRRAWTADHRETDLGNTAAVSDRGYLHSGNEDAYAVASDGETVSMVVCDGVSSTPDADASAAAAADAAAGALTGFTPGASDPRKWVLAAVAAACEPWQRSIGPEPGSTTIVVALTDPGGVTVANVGDSRGYWIGDDGEVELLTTDDSAAQMAIEAGLAPDEAYALPQAHQITAWLGPDAGVVVPHVQRITPRGPGLVILCSDGLWNYTQRDSAFAALIGDPSAAEPLEVARRLVQSALDAGGSDNVTVAVARHSPRSHR